MGRTSEWSGCLEPDRQEYYPRERSSEISGMLDKYTSRKFHDEMDDRMLVSHYKYGDSRLGYPDHANALKSLEKRIALYLETGNAEYLVDAANFAMIEYMHPSISHAHFKATDSDGSPGLVTFDGKESQEAHIATFQRKIQK
jgi:hypothetical protein